MFTKNVCLSILVTLPLSTFAGVEKATELFKKRRGEVGAYPAIAAELAEDGVYLTSVPLLKEFLVSGGGDKADEILDRVISHVGVRPFEVLNREALERSSSPMAKFILAKKYFRVGKYHDALAKLAKQIPNESPAKPYSLYIEGAAHSLLGKNSEAQPYYKECIEVSEDSLGDATDIQERQRLMLNRDYCTVALPRALFAEGKFTDSSFQYLDLPKSSPVWPEILFEEAWSSFYQKDYNRTLGKLVSYKAPVFTHIFNPEIEVLTALTYMELCLWNDTKKAVDDFYEKYQVGSERVRRKVEGMGKDYKAFYQLIEDYNDSKNKSDTDLLNVMLNSISRDGTFLELRKTIEIGKSELAILKGKNSGPFSNLLKVALLDARDLVGSYVRKRLLTNLYSLDRTLENMSYIKLEVLSRKKAKLYSSTDLNEDGKRGDIKYLQRNDKQYFWSFNGEFWADELGDYVFALKSECE